MSINVVNENNNVDEVLECSDGTFLVDWEIISRIIRGLIRNVLMNKHSIQTPMLWESWWDRRAQNVGLLPKIDTLTTNWKLVDMEMNSLLPKKLFSLRSIALDKGMGDFFIELNFIRDEGQKAYKQYQQRYGDISKRGMERITSKVDQLDTAIDVSKVIRDTSADIVVAGATFMSGGAALALLAGGSVAKGVFKYQDTDNIGSAILEATGTFIVGIIPIRNAAAGIKTGLKVTAKDKVQKYVILVFVEAPITVAQGLIEGKSLQESLFKSAIKVMSDHLGHVVMNNKVVKNVVSKMALPVTVKISEGPIKNIAPELARSIIGGKVKSYVGQGGEMIIRKVIKADIKKGTTGSLANSVTLFSTQNSAWRPIYSQAVQALNSTSGATLSRIRGC